MELTERHVSQLLEAVKATADAATASTTTAHALGVAITNLSKDVQDLRTQVAIMARDQQRNQEEQAAMNKRLWGDKDDGVIQRIETRAEDIRLELATKIDDNHRAGKRTDGMMAVVNGAFSMLTSFVMKQFGGH